MSIGARIGKVRKMKMIRRLFCKHKHVKPLYTYLEQQEDCSWITHTCGSVWIVERRNHEKNIAKSILWFLLWLYVSNLQRDVVQILKITKDFDIVCFVIFVASINFLSIFSCLKNVNTYFWEKIMEDNEDD